jgi:hypothetical protein
VQNRVLYLYLLAEYYFRVAKSMSADFIPFIDTADYAGRLTAISIKLQGITSTINTPRL